MQLGNKSLAAFLAGEVYAYIGAMGEDVTGIEPNIIEMFFVHPQWDGNLIYADVAVGLLTEPVSDVPKVQASFSRLRVKIDLRS